MLAITSLRRIFISALVLFGFGAAAQIAVPAPQETLIEWLPSGAYERISLTVAAPDGVLFQQEFGQGEIPRYVLGKAAIDGLYKYELTMNPLGSQPQPEISEEERGLAATGDITPPLQSGTFAVAQGVLVQPSEEPRLATKQQGFAGGSDSDAQTKDQVVPDDMIVQSSICAGFDCVDGESFGADTIRLKENNLRIHFDDTSAAEGFAARDWRIIANGQYAGEAEKFSIEDATAGTEPFYIEGNTPSNTLYVDNAQRVGIGTSLPEQNLHMNSGDTPGIRLEQNGGGGFTAQTWDVAGNEANFFVRDLTGGSHLPLRIRPGAPTSALDIGSLGVGIGTQSPAATLHVKSYGSAPDLLRMDDSAENAVFRVRSTSMLPNTLVVSWQGKVGIGTGIPTAPLHVKSGDLNLFIVKAGGNVGVGTETPNARLHVVSSTGSNLLRVLNTGTVEVQNLVQTSDRNAKEHIEPVDKQRVLEQVSKLPINEWSFKESSERHVGPMAQDFHAAFALSADDRHISPMDLGGVAIAALQALDEARRAQSEELAALKARNAELEARLGAIEAALAAR